MSDYLSRWKEQAATTPTPPGRSATPAAHPAAGPASQGTADRAAPREPARAPAWQHAAGLMPPIRDAVAGFRVRKQTPPKQASSSERERPESEPSPARGEPRRAPTLALALAGVLAAGVVVLVVRRAARGLRGAGASRRPAAAPAQPGRRWSSPYGPNIDELQHLEDL